jgi:hypothetical protein
LIVSQQRNWEGNQIVSRAWVEQSTHTDPSNNSRHYYNNNWGPKNTIVFMLLDFTVNTLYPEKNIQIIRFGDSHYPTTQITGKIYLFKLLIS